MRIGLLAAMVAVLVHPGLTHADPPSLGGVDDSYAGWRSYESSRGRFRILFPEDPVVTETAHRTLAGQVRTQRYRVRRDDAEFAVEVNDLPGIAAVLLSDAAILDRAARGLLDDIDARERASDRISWQGYPGRRVAYDILDERHWVEEALLVLVDTRLYIVMAGHRREVGAVRSAAPFFDSFEIRPRAPEVASD